MGRRTVLMVVAIVIAALGATLVFFYVQGINDRAQADQAPVQVLTVKEVIAAGETIDAAQAAGKLVLSDIPTVNVLPGALATTQSILGMIALAPVYPGEQIIPQRFGAPGTQERLTIPDGTLAISIQLSDPSRVAGFVNPGSNVAIFLAGDGAGTPTAGQPAGQFVRLLLPAVQVIGVGATTLLNTTTTDASGAQTVEQIPKTILTLALTQDQAQRVMLASRSGELVLGLLTDKSVVKPGPGVTAVDLFK